MTEPTILIVDDDDDDRFIIAEVFEKVGGAVNLKLASNGMEAISYLLETPKEELPCLVVLDYNMPGMNGREVLGIICNHEKLKDLPTIIFSTANAPDLIKECLNSGAKAFRTKPNQYKDLMNTVQEMLEFCKIGVSK